MTQQTLSIKRKRDDKQPIEVHYDMPSSLEDAVSRFDGELALEKTVFQLVITAIKQQLSDYVRRLATTEDPETGKNRTKTQIQALVDAWKPGERNRAKAEVSKVAGLAKAMTPEQREALLAELGVKPDAAAAGAGAEA